MKTFVAFLLAAAASAAVVAVPAAAAAAPREADYKVVCTQAVVGSGVGPQVCLPVPVEP